MGTGRKAVLVVSLIALWMSPIGVATTGGAQCTLISVGCPPPGNIVFTPGLRASPRALPEAGHVPVRWHLFGKVGTVRGNHPPALRELLLDVDKDVSVDAENYPACGRRRLEGRSSRAAMRSCREAFLGEGGAHIEVASAEGATPLLLSSRLLVFNAAGGAANAKLLIHAHFAGTTPGAVVAAVTLQEKGAGLSTTSRIPPIAGGLGSIVEFEFHIGATYPQGNRKVGYFEARCPDGVFKANVKKVLFQNEAQTPGEAAQTTLKGSLAVPCTGKR